MIITFTGHSVVTSREDVKKAVKEEIKKNISNVESVTFYLGGYGDFDNICALACKELKQERTDIELVYVTPYISPSEQAKIKELQKCGYCDSSLYPPIESVPTKFAIIKRNEWMMSNADLIIAYVNRTYGGAYKALQIAKRRKRKIINICVDEAEKKTEML